MQHVPSPFATNLRAALAEREMTQEALAREVDVGLRVVQEWCSGRIDAPRWRHLTRVAQVLDVEPASLLAAADHDPTPA